MALPFDPKGLPRYEILAPDPVGSGGCGIVWPARDRLFGERVALKTLRPDLLGRLPHKARRSFWKEAQAGARLGHLTPHVVRVLDYGLVDDQPYFTMEWLRPRSGSSLDVSSMVGASTVSEAIGIAIQAGTGLQTAHNAGVIHSDVAPWNIFRSDDGVVRVADFGLLAVIEGALVSSASGSLLQGGRADFQPEEVRVSIGNLTQSADVYALAVTTLVLLVGGAVLPSQTGRRIDISDGMVIRKEQRPMPASLSSLLRRHIVTHTVNDTVQGLLAGLERIPR